LKGDFLGVSILPKPVKTLFAAIYFVEASLLIYGLAIKFPIEYNVLFAAAFLVYALAHRMWVQTPIKREQADGQTSELLEQALERLKDLTGLGRELKVVWKPGHSKLAGEVIGKTIYIYVDDPDEAFETLAHEFVEYIVTRPQKPLLRFINALSLLVREQAYRETDKIAEALSKMLIDKIRSEWDEN
jgi:hypothetical protein